MKKFYIIFKTKNKGLQLINKMHLDRFRNAKNYVDNNF